MKHSVWVMDPCIRSMLLTLNLISNETLCNSSKECEAGCWAGEYRNPEEGQYWFQVPVG